MVGIIGTVGIQQAGGGGGACADATVNVNGNLFDTVASGATIDIPVLQDGNPVGSLVDGEWIIPPAPASLGFNICRRSTGSQTSTITDTGIWLDVTLTTLLPYASCEGGGLKHLGDGVVENESASAKTVNFCATTGMARSTGTSLSVKFTVGFWNGSIYAADETYQTGNYSLPPTNNSLSSSNDFIEIPDVVIPAGGRIKLKFWANSRSSTLVNLATYWYTQHITEKAA